MKNSSYLIQRLQKPRNYEKLGFKDNPFSFGGGLKNGGLTSEAMDLLRQVFSFDYMGSAEFEWGAVPKALSAIFENRKKFVGFSFTIALKDVAKPWNDKTDEVPEGEATVYVLCLDEDRYEAVNRIQQFAAQGFKYRLKEVTQLERVLRPGKDEEKYPPRTCGWLELDNGWFFFTDPEMWENTAQLFEIEIA